MHSLQAIGDEIKLLKKKIKGARELVLLTELKQRIRVLKRLDFVSPDNVVTLKVRPCLLLSFTIMPQACTSHARCLSTHEQGRVASEISTGDELVVTELVFSGFFKELNGPQLCAILSCFVWRERSEVRQVMAVPRCLLAGDPESQLQILRIYPSPLHFSGAEPKSHKGWKQRFQRCGTRQGEQTMRCGNGRGNSIFAPTCFSGHIICSPYLQARLQGCQRLSTHLGCRRVHEFL